MLNEKALPRTIPEAFSGLKIEMAATAFQRLNSRRKSGFFFINSTIHPGPPLLNLKTLVPVEEFHRVG